MQVTPTIKSFMIMGHPCKAKGAPSIAGMVKFLMGMGESSLY